MKRPFSKPPTTFADQVTILTNRGMDIPDPAQAEFYLQQLNYYRLGAYWLPFESDHTTHQFKPGTSFDGVLNLYIFDRELRLLVLDAIERVEVSVRTQWAYHMAHQHGSHAHLDSSLAYRSDHYQRHLSKLADEVKRSDETFISHLLNTYQEQLPPVWATCEVMSFGLLSKWYANLKPMPTRQIIARSYTLNEKVLQSWLQHLSLVRNTCAHHSRLWNRDFTIIPVIPHQPSTLASQFHQHSRKLYNSLVILLHFMDIIAPQHSWRQRLKTLLAAHNIPVTSMGFPSGWEQLPIWQETQP